MPGVNYGGGVPRLRHEEDHKTMAKKINIRIYEIPHTEDGNGYDLSHAKATHTIYTNAAEYAADKSKALVIAGAILATRSGLIAIRDDAESDVAYIHNGCHGFAVLTEKDAVNTHLHDRYWGMKLVGSLPGKPRKASKDEILAKLDDWAKYAFAEDLDDEIIEKGGKAGLELWQMVFPYMNEQQRKRFADEWYGVCDPDTLKGIIEEALDAAN